MSQSRDAAIVLTYFRRGAGRYAGTPFEQALVRAIDLATFDQQLRLAKGYPGLVEAVRTAREGRPGLRRLEECADKAPFRGI